MKEKDLEMFIFNSERSDLRKRGLEFYEDDFYVKRQARLKGKCPDMLLYRKRGSYHEFIIVEMKLGEYSWDHYSQISSYELPLSITYDLLRTELVDKVIVRKVLLTGGEKHVCFPPHFIEHYTYRMGFLDGIKFDWVNRENRVTYHDNYYPVSPERNFYYLTQLRNTARKLTLPVPPRVSGVTAHDLYRMGNRLP